jgi:hypothetical protein
MTILKAKHQKIKQHLALNYSKSISNIEEKKQANSVIIKQEKKVKSERVP